MCAHLLTEKIISCLMLIEIVVIGRSRILPYDLAERIAPMASFRNIVVQRYLSIDPEKVADILHNQLGEFDEFSFHIHDYLRREGYITDETQDE